MTTIEATQLTTNDNDTRHERLDGQCANDPRWLLMFIGIDVGHTNLKAVAFDDDWNTLAKHGIDTGMVTTGQDHREIPIGERWDLLVECLSELQSKTSDREIRASAAVAAASTRWTRTRSRS